MTYTEQELRTMLAQSHTMPKGPARFAALEEVIRHADALGLEQFAFDVRMNATSDFHHGGEPVKAFLSFSWCLAAYDRDPARYNAYVEGRLRWHFKWMVWALPQFPDIPLERTFAVLDDMQQRYLRAGQSLHAVYQHRWLVAHHLGDMPAAQQWHDQMVTARRDGNSDCGSCVPSSQVRHLASLGRHEEAVRIGEPVRRGGCSEQPQWINSELLLPYLRTGRYAEAVEAHRLAYRRIRDDRHHLDNIAQHVLFCALTHNESKGLELVERHLPWLERPSSPFAAMEFASAAANVLTRLVDTGRGTTPVRRTGTHSAPEGEDTVAGLREEMRQLARALAARFDARNANTHQSERVETRMSLEPLDNPVPLTVLAATPAPGSARDTIGKLVEQVARLTEYGDVPGAARARAQVATALMRAKRWADAAETAEEAVRELDRAGLVDEAASCRYLLSQVYRRDHQTKAAVALLDELLDSGVQVADVPTAARLHEEAAGALGYGRAAAERYRTAAHLYAAEGRHTDQIRVLHGAIRNLTYPNPEAALATLAEADTVLAAHTRPEPAWREAAAHIDLAAADILRRTGDPAAAAIRAQRAIQTLDTTDPAETLARAHAKLASLHLLLDNPADAEAAARQALTLSPDSEDTWDTAALLAKALTAQHRGDEAAHIARRYGFDLDDLDEYDFED